jgi:hypothetical protein
LSPPKPFEPTSFQLVVVQFPRGGFSPPEGRLARGCKPPAFSRFLFQSAVQSAESFWTHQLSAGGSSVHRRFWLEWSDNGDAALLTLSENVLGLSDYSLITFRSARIKWS